MKTDLWFHFCLPTAALKSLGKKCIMQHAVLLAISVPILKTKICKTVWKLTKSFNKLGKRKKHLLRRAVLWQIWMLGQWQVWKTGLMADRCGDVPYIWRGWGGSWAVAGFRWSLPWPPRPSTLGLLVRTDHRSRNEEEEMTPSMLLLLLPLLLPINTHNISQRLSYSLNLH